MTYWAYTYFENKNFSEISRRYFFKLQNKFYFSQNNYNILIKNILIIILHVFENVQASKG